MNLLLCNLGFIITGFYSCKIAPAIIDFINIFPATDVSPAQHYSFLQYFLPPCRCSRITVVIKRDKD